MEEARRQTRKLAYLAVQRFRQGDGASAWIYDEMVRELYAIFHWRSFGIVALKYEHFRSDFGWFWERQARGVSSRLQDRWFVYIVGAWNNKSFLFSELPG